MSPSATPAAAAALLLLLLLAASVATASPAGPQKPRHTLRSHCGRNRFDSQFAQFLSTLYRKRAMAKRIVGGQGAASGQWPWLVSLRFLRRGAKQHTHMCGGTLVHPKWVVSAAHCFEKSSAYPDISANASSWVVRVGEHDMDSDQDAQHDDIPVSRVVVHPGRKFSYNDIAVIELAEETPITENKNAACLPSAEDKFPAGTVCYTAGWGQESEASESHSAVLRHVAVPVVPRQLCAKAYGSLRPQFASLGAQYVSYADITDSMLCAGLKEGGGDSCQFDSGGPLMCRDPGDKEQWLIAGVISYGYGCGRQGYPGVYTKVTSYLGWVNSVVDNYSFN